MTSPASEDLVERVARAIAGHFGPEFDDLPKDRKAQRESIRQGDAYCDNQAEMINAAQAAIAAFPDLSVLQGEVERLRNALMPLAECEIIECEPPLPNSDSARYFIRMGEIRAARAALSPQDDAVSGQASPGVREP